MDCYAIDFETTYAKGRDINSLGTWHYLSHPETDIYMVSIVGDEFEWVGHPNDAPWSDIDGAVWVSHNAAFDAMVYATLGREERPSVWNCSADLCAYLGVYRSLDKASKALLGVDVSKDMRNWMKGRTWEDAQREGKADQLLQYALDDSRYCYRIWKEFSHKQPEQEREISRITTTIGWRGVALDKERLDQGILKVQEVMREAEDLLPWEGTPQSLNKLGQACREVGIEAPSTTAEGSPECEQWLERYGDKYPWVAAMGRWRKATLMYSRLRTLRSRIRPSDGCVSTPLKYFGATQTGRWSGGGGFNFQNLYREERFGVDLRSCLIPRDGKKFIICDLSQIEPRVLATLVGDTKTLDLIRSGIDCYEAHARASMGYEDPRPLKDVDNVMRGLAKARVLALSYGVGSGKFVGMAKTLAGLELSLEESKLQVSEFRKTNPKTINFWNTLERGIKLSTSRGEPYEIELPSGRVINYWNLRNEMFRGRKQVRADIALGDDRNDSYYGAKLCENVVQATARDVFAECLLRVNSDPRFDVVLHVHDEVIVEADPDIDAQEILPLMTQQPNWLPELPVEATAESAECYKK